MKCAYVTLISDDQPDFIYNIILGYSLLKSKTKYDIILLYTLDVPFYKIKLLSNFFTHVIKVEKVLSLKKEFNRSLSYFFTKFQIFTLTDYDKLLYLDKYQFINKNIDYLFQLQTPSTFCFKNKFKRSHMFLVSPNKELFKQSLKIIDKQNLNVKYIDKNILNILFKNTKLNCFSSKLDFQKIININPNININQVSIIDYNFIYKPNKFICKKNILTNKEFIKYKKYYLPWLNDYKQLYILLKNKNIDLKNLYSIISTNYLLYLKNLYPNMKIYKINNNYKSIIDNLLNEPINNYYTFKDIINIFKQYQIPLFIYGGSIRDLYINTEISDIDFYYISNYKMINKILKSIPNLYFKQGLFKKYFNIEYGEMELSNFDNLRKSLDAPCNSLIYDLQNNNIYDLTGIGIDDSKKKIWRKPPNDTFEEWSIEHNNLIYRLVKFLNKEFKIPEQDRKDIYNELYYIPKDRNYWHFLKSPKYYNDEFFNTIIKDIDSLNLNYSGQEFINKYKENIKPLLSNNK